MTNHNVDGNGSANFVDKIQAVRMMMKQSMVSNNNNNIEHNEGMKNDARVAPNQTRATGRNEDSLDHEKVHSQKWIFHCSAQGQ